MDTDSLPNKILELRNRCWLGGLICTVLFALYWLTIGREAGHHAYLIAFLFVLAPTLGSLGLLCAVHLTSGKWGFCIRRILEAAMKNIPILALMFVPVVLFSMNALYSEWITVPSAEDFHMGHEIIAGKTVYLNKTFWIIRAIICFVIWGGLGHLLYSYSQKQDETGDLHYRKKMKFIAGPAALLYALTLTVASVDWVMSMEPIWFSAIYGVMFFVEQFTWTLALCILMLTWLFDKSPVNTVLDRQQLHNVGKLMFAFVCLWGYINISQFIIIWSANLPEENTWYVNRSSGLFQAITIFLIVGAFFLPFLSMLNRHVKRQAPVIRYVAFWLIFVRVVYLFWLVVPSRYPEVTQNALIEEGMRVAEPINMTIGMYGFGGIILAVAGLSLLWLGCFFNNFHKLPILPIKDPVFSPHWNQEVNS